MHNEQQIEISWVKLKVDRLMTSPDVQQMEAHEFGAYMLILLTSFYQKKRGFVKNDEKYLRKITRLSPKQWKESKDLVLSKFKTDNDGDLYNERWLSEIRDAESYILNNKSRTEVARQTRLNGKQQNKPKTEQPDKSYSDGIKTSNWASIGEYVEYRELVFSQLDENLIGALKEKIGITRPYCWANRQFPQGYFDLVDCISRIREDVEWQSSVMQNYSLTKKALLQNIYDFVKEIKDAQLYMAYDGYNGSDGNNNFISHFVRWQKNKLSR